MQTETISVSREYSDPGKTLSLQSVNQLDTYIKQCKSQFQANINKYEGRVYEHGDQSDTATANIQRSIDYTERKCDKYTRPSLVKKLVGSIPLPLFLPVMRKRLGLLTNLDLVESALHTSTGHRMAYGHVTSYAFNSLDHLCSVSKPDDTEWCPRFQLFETPSPEKTWHILGYTEEGFLSWWTKNRSEPTISKSWADMKALCKNVVFICDNAYPESMRQIPHIERIKSLVDAAQRTAVMLVRLLSRHPERARAISALFGFTVPLIFALSRITDEAKGLLSYDKAIAELKAEHILRPLFELKPLVEEIATLIKDFGTRLRCHPYMELVREDMKGLTYSPKPSIAHLFNINANDFTTQAETIVLETGLERDRESFAATVAQIQKEEVADAGRKVLEEALEESSAYDLTVLRDLGLEEIFLSDLPVGMIGYGSSAMVAEFSCYSNSSRRVAVKHFLKIGERTTWNTVVREASTWVNLKHRNVLPLLGYCMISIGDTSEKYPALVTPLCSGGNLKLFLKDRLVSEQQRMELLYDVASGLSYLHSRKVCHGDLRAANILVDESSGKIRALICDFGLSDFFEEVVGRLYKTDDERRGADRWLAPELIRLDSCKSANGTSAARVSSEADMYAFGCVILEVACGKEPFHAYARGSENDAKLRGELPACKEEMGSFLSSLAMKCWEPLPSRRPKSAEVTSYLNDYIQNI